MRPDRPKPLRTSACSGLDSADEIRRTLAAVFERSGVERAHPHRSRHTLLSKLLGKGGTRDEIAAIFGDSLATIHHYYGKWTEEYQSRQDTLIRKIHDTNLDQTARTDE